MIFLNAGFVNPMVFVNGSRRNLDPIHTSWNPEFRTEFSGTGNVTLNGLIPLLNGNASFIWTGAEGGNLYSTDSVVIANVNGEELEDKTIRPIWTRTLTVLRLDL